MLEVAEERRADKQTNAQAAVILIVVEQVLAVTVIEVQHQELVVPPADAEPHVNDRIETHVPSLALDKRGIEHPSLIGGKVLPTHLENAVILEDVLVLLSVNDGNPRFGVQHDIGQNIGRAAQRDFVPAARCLAVASVGLVLKNQRGVSHQLAVVDDQLRQTDSGIEVQVMERQRLLKDVPHRFL